MPRKTPPMPFPVAGLKTERVLPSAPPLKITTSSMMVTMMIS
jgi:hypothetical protein